MKTTRKILNHIFILLGIILITSSGCQKDTTTTSISDYNFYSELGVTLINCYTDIYNQNLAGVATGNQSKTSEGPMGGIVVITGSDSYDNTHGITTTDLVFSMNSVKYTYSYTGSNNKTWVTEVTITGSTTYKGSFSSSYTSVNHQSTDLYIKGSVTYNGTVRKIDETGDVNINRSSTTSVNIFGNTVTW